MISNGTKQVIALMKASLPTWSEEDKNALVNAICHAISTEDCIIVPVRFNKNHIEASKRGQDIKIKHLDSWFKDYD